MSSLTEISWRLTKLASRVRATSPTAAETLLIIGGGLGAGGAQFAGVELVRAYPPEVLVPDAGRSRYHRIAFVLEILRDVLVFLPVALTWWQLRSALNAFERSPDGTSFLLGWQQGFGGQTTSLSTAALWVALIVAAIIVASLAMHACLILDEGARSRADERVALAGDLTLATALVAGQEHTQIDHVPFRELSKAGSKIAASNKQLVDALAAAQRGIAEAMATGPGSPMHTALSTWTAAADRLYAVSESLKSPANTLEKLKELHEAVVEDGRKLRDELQRLAASLLVHTTAMTAESHTYSAVATEVRHSVEKLGLALEGFTTHANSLSEVVLQLRGVLVRQETGYAMWEPQPSPLGNVGPPDGDGR